ncbi:branched-chain amino acid transport system permease protein [Labrenzia sp. EL_208]|uniref:branched-chain amino acid ABC transporter permease n=1 Tax=Roseibium album TaxID=311410 RepID=UPI000D553CB3|nr:branched-chain amino acid ABC transporter permease [Roseibium album]MBG6173012.1 branched-chain amino acid transport system permease protein [Labrenzia sp. EL_132]MBG6228218.1 branched-chain amino acid transport system permease protein [Labrenzia sp. EL_208]
MKAASVSNPETVQQSKRIDRALLVGLALILLLAIMPLLTEFAGGNYVLNLVMKAMILAIAAISLDLLIGYGGLVSFGHAAFLGLGSYVTGIALAEGTMGALPILGMVVLVCGLFALVTGALSLRTSGVYFIMITLAFGQMVYFFLTSLSNYGGDDGLTLWDTPQLFGFYVFQNGSGLFYSILVVLALTWLFVGRLSQSRFGRVLRAGKASPVRAETMGFDIFQYRLIAYVIAGVLAGVAGFLSACHAEFISPSTATWQNSGNLIIMVILGGMGTRNGALLGALFVVLIEEGLSLITHEWKLIFGPMLVLIVLFARGGLAGVIDRLGGRS